MESVDESIRKQHQTLMEFDSNSEFIQKVNPYFDFLGYTGVKILGYKGVCIMMPLSPKMLVLFYDSNVYKIGNRKGKVAISEPILVL